MAKAIFNLSAELRSLVGKGASRRLRRTSETVPAILYGANKPPMKLTLKNNEINKATECEAFFSHIVTLTVNGSEEKAIVKDLQRHPSRGVILHVDFLRISATEKLTMHIPLHMEGGEKAVGVKEGGQVTQFVNEIEIRCLPANLPEYIAINIANLALNQTIHLSDVTLPEGVELARPITEEHNPSIVSIQIPQEMAEVSNEAPVAPDSVPAINAAVDKDAAGKAE